MALLTDEEKGLNERFFEGFNHIKNNTFVGSEKDLCKYLGIHQTNLGKYKGLERAIPITAVIRLITLDDMFDGTWFITGSGMMLKETPVKLIPSEAVRQDGVPAGYIPLYDININAGNVQRLLEDNNDVPLVGWVHLEDMPVKSGLIGVRAKGDSMATFIDNGDVMLIRRIEDWSFIPLGQAFVLIGNDMSAVKYIYDEPSKDEWLLTSHNSEKHKPFTVAKSSIRHLFVVVKVLKDLTY